VKTKQLDILKLNDQIVALWENNRKTRAKALALKAFSDKRIQKNLFFYIHNGIFLRENDDHKTAYKFFKKAVELSPDNELSSMCKYIELVQLNKDKLAIKELERYLSKYKAKSYKITLIELLEGMSRGFSTDYEKTIIGFCIKNKVKGGSIN